MPHDIISERRARYRSVNSTPDGHWIFQDLSRLFYDRPSYVVGDTHQTAFLEGQRSVIFMLRMLLADEPEAKEATK